MITAILGFIIFSESLPPLWFLGAALLVAGNVIIGRRDEESAEIVGAGATQVGAGAEPEGAYTDVIDGQGESLELETEQPRQETDDDVLDLEFDERRQSEDLIR